jgi:Flp pilus assembly protein TadG
MQTHGHTHGKQERANALVMTVLFMGALFGFAALSIDMGNVYTNRLQMQEGADSAAMGAVQDWALETDATKTVSSGTKIATNNNIQSTEIISITPGVWHASTKTFEANTSNFAVNSIPAVRVIVQRAVVTYFAKLFGFSTITVRVQSIAAAGQATAATSLMPWAVCQPGNQTPNPCASVTLKFSDVGGGDPCANPGNYGAVALGGTGANVYRNNIENGYPGIVRIGDVIPTQTGNMVGPTDQGLSARIAGAPPYNCDPADPVVPSQRLAIVIVTTPSLADKQNVVVTAFWVFAMDDPQHGQVTGKYLKVFAGTEIDPSKPPPSGSLAGVALVN